MSNQRQRLAKSAGAILAALTLALGMPASAEESPAPGRFLIAADDLDDPNFAKTVVLLVRYDATGALGVVLNRASDVRVSRAFPDLEGPKKRRVVYKGGPVEHGQWGMLFRAKSAPDNALHIFEDVYLTDDTKLLELWARESASRGEFRVYAGYAGWRPGQLDGEIARGGWHVVDGDVATVFGHADEETWKELLPRNPREWTRKGTDFKSVPDRPMLAPARNAFDQIVVAELRH